MELNELLIHRVGANTVQNYLEALAIVFGVSVGFGFLRKFIIARMNSSTHLKNPELGQFLKGLLKKIRVSTFVAIGLYFGSEYLILPPVLQKAAHAVILVILVFQFIRLSDHFFRFLFPRAVYGRSGRNPETDNSLKHLLTLVNIFFWIAGILFIFSNLGFNVASALAGLGIGGIAVALAAQNILGDVFSSFVILIEKPFEVGDLIQVGDDKGQVQYIGMKTTRIRSENGEMIVIPNSDMTRSRIHNYQNLLSQRISFRVRVAYNTPIEKLKAIPAIARGVVEGQPNTKFGEIHFSQIADFGIVFDGVYTLLNPKGTQIVELQQTVYVSLVEALGRQGIQLVFNAPEHLRVQ